MHLQGDEEATFPGFNHGHFCLGCRTVSASAHSTTKHFLYPTQVNLAFIKQIFFFFYPSVYSKPSLNIVARFCKTVATVEGASHVVQVLCSLHALPRVLPITPRSSSKQSRALQTSASHALACAPLQMCVHLYTSVYTCTVHTWTRSVCVQLHTKEQPPFVSLSLATL